jgi:8-amino-7-oxononanoate synthase
MRVRDYKKYDLSFCGNDYLGLSQHPDVIQAFKNSADQYGVGTGGSHLLSGHKYPHYKLEEELADFMGYPRALLFSSGYMANLGIITTMIGRSDIIFQDRLNHASLIDAGRYCGAKFKRYKHNDTDNLKNLLLNLTEKNQKKLIATDCVFSMDGDIAPLPELVTFSKQFKTNLMIDDAHGIGVLGKQGKGTLDYYGLNSIEVPVLMGTLSKAFGTFGAFVAGSHDFIETLIQTSRPYIFTTALPSAIADATRVSLRLIQHEPWRRERLAQRVNYFREKYVALGLPFLPSITPIQPLVIGSTENTMYVAELLKSKSIRVDAIRPPTVPKNQSRLRVTINVNHTEKQIDYLLEMLATVIASEAKQSILSELGFTG